MVTSLEVIDRRDSYVYVNDSQLNEKKNYSEIFKEIFDSFNRIYELAPQTLKNSTSYEFSILVKASENYLIAAKEFIKMSSEEEDQITKMQKQFDELVKMIPPGPCVLLQRNIDSFLQLSQISPYKKYASKNGEDYCEPRVSLVEITSYFQAFNDENGYAGIGVAMKRDNFYQEYKNRMMTLVGFVKSQRGFLKNYLFKEDIKKINTSLLNLASAKVQDWGFEGLEIIFSEEDNSNEMMQRIKKENKYRCFVIYFHKQWIDSEEDKISQVVEQETKDSPLDELNENILVETEVQHRMHDSDSSEENDRN